MTSLFVTHEISGSLQALGMGYTAHSCRHRFGRKLFEVTKDIRVVQELLGHESIRTTERYTDASSAVALKALNKIAEPLERVKRRPA